jgi:hypothetical protein
MEETIIPSINELTVKQKNQMNDFANLCSYVQTPHSRAFLSADYGIVFVSKGNQAGGTALIGYSYVLRILGWHPVPKKNMTYFECRRAVRYNTALQMAVANETEEPPESEDGHYFSPKDYYERIHGKGCPSCGEEMVKHERTHKIYRFASQNLPEPKTMSDGKVSDASAETRNTQYPEFMLWLPKFLLKRDITSREKAQYIYDVYGGKDITVEYSGYNQQTQTVAGHKRASVWLDELAPEPFFDEQPARLMIEDGDINISYTPTQDNGISYYYDRIFEPAKVFYRSKAMREYYKKTQNIDYPEIEFTKSNESIAIIQMATDDNPKLSRKVIDEKYAALGGDDPHLIDMRRYGIFAAVTGKIYKQFVPRVHVISEQQHLPHGIPSDWTFFRSEDYHQHNDLAIIFVAMSPRNEAFVWAELSPDPEKNTTLAVCEMIAEVSGDKNFAMNLIDPLASTNQSNTGKSVTEDMNDYFLTMKREEICSGGYWESANTKSGASKASHNIRGREQLKLRLYNASLCGKPFNNRVEKDGVAKRLPTIWILDSCTKMARSLKSWRLENGKETVAWSHFCTALEFLLKDIRFAPRSGRKVIKRRPIHSNYFNKR